MLQDKPDFEKLELAEFLLTYITGVKPKMILPGKFDTRTLSSVVNIKTDNFYFRCMDIMRSNPHAIDFIK